MDFSASATATEIFHFPIGSSIGQEYCMEFDVFQDGVPEPETESVTLELQAFDIGVVIPQSTFTFTFVDDDDGKLLYFYFLLLGPVSV